MAVKSRVKSVFNAQAFLDSSGIAKTTREFAAGDVIFAQGDACESVYYLKEGSVKLSVLSKAGREAVVAILDAGNFFGEGCLAGQPVRMGNATAASPSIVLEVKKQRMVRLLHTERTLHSGAGLCTQKSGW